jgi:hypothetical protein
MLQQLTQITVLDVTIGALVRIIGNLTITFTTVGKHRYLGHVAMHSSFLRSEFPDLFPGIFASTAFRTPTIFDMLDCVRSRLEAAISTNRTRNVTRTMYLHVHFETVATLEHAAALVTAVRGVDAFAATRNSVSLPPLIVAVLVRRLVIAAFGTVTTRAAASVDTAVATRNTGAFTPLIV